MNELTDQLITLFSSILITVMFLAVAVNIFRRNHAPDTRHPLKWRIPVGHLVLLVRMFHTGRMEALGLKKHSLKVLLYAPAAGYLLVLAIHFLLDKAGLFQWIEHATNAPAEQSIVSVLRHSSDIPLITVICFSAAIAAPLVEELIFRGYLYPIMKKYTGVWFALITTSLLFGIIHVSLVPFIPLAIFGAVLVLLYEYTGSIWTPIIAHCIFNTATLINILYPGILLPYGT